MKRVRAEKGFGKDIKAGELFSAVGPEYWDLFPRLTSIGERVYIRTNTPLRNDQAQEEVYRITVEEGKG